MTDKPAAAPVAEPRPSRTERLARIGERWGWASMLFVIIAATFGAVFAWLTPPFWGHDEITQFGRGYQVSYGWILPHEIEDTRGVAYGGGVPRNVDNLMGFAFNDYRNNPDEPSPMVFDPGVYRALEDYPIGDEQKTIWFTNTAAYSPVAYVPAAVAVRASVALGLDVGGLVLAMRLAGLLSYLVVVAFALRALRHSRFQWVAFTVSLLPIAVFQAGTITADTLTNALAILVSALIVKGLFLGDKLTRVEAGALLAAAVALPLCKPTYVLLALLVVVVPPDRLGLTGRLRWLPAVFAGLGFAAFAAWTKISSPTTEGMGLMRKESQWHSVIPGEQLKFILGNPIDFLNIFGESILRRDQEWFTEFFGELGFSYVNVPAASIVAFCFAFTVAALTSERMMAARQGVGRQEVGRQEVRRERLRTTIVALAILASAAMIFVTLYMSFTPVRYYIIDGVQGRYFVPLAIVFVAVFLRWMPLRLTPPAGTVSQKWPAVAVVVAVVIGLLFAVLKYNAIVWG